MSTSARFELHHSNSADRSPNISMVDASKNQRAQNRRRLALKYAEVGFTAAVRDRLLSATVDATFGEAGFTAVETPLQIATRFLGRKKGLLYIGSHLRRKKTRLHPRPRPAIGENRVSPLSARIAGPPHKVLLMFRLTGFPIPIGDNMNWRNRQPG